MDFPGENLVIKMWETLTEKGIGSLLKPYQMRREGKALNDVRREEMLAIAKAEMDVMDLKLGKKSYHELTHRLGSSNGGNQSSLERVEPKIDFDTIYEISEGKVRFERVRKEINTLKAILYAEEAISDSVDEPPEESIDEEWLFRWSGYTGDVSSEGMQRLWGKLLAGELKAPGAYSFRVLEFMRCLSQSEAKLIERVSTLSLQGVIWAEHSSERSLTFKEALELENIGIISGVSGSIANTVGAADPKSGEWYRVLTCHDKCLVIRHADVGVELKLESYNLSSLGEQMLSLGKFEADLNYLKRLGRHLVANGFTVTLADVVSAEGNITKWQNGLKITLE